jgi:alpha-beta hydrolase superfamily lysophospholipase
MTPPLSEYPALDRPEILSAIFHPRPQWEDNDLENGSTNQLIPVEDNVHIGATFHMCMPDAPSILFFHGNGEIVSDYDELAPLYRDLGINFLVADYRGYGRSSGSPTVTAMMRDCHIILDYTVRWLENNDYAGPLIVMGRSLGSASALELAASRADQVQGLIIESGFAFAAPLLQLLGVNVSAIGFDETMGFGNIDKIKQFKRPTLVIHAEFDHIIPFSDGQTLYDAAGAEEKKLIKIDGANHNDIFFRGLTSYMTAVRSLVDGVITSFSG